MGRWAMTASRGEMIEMFKQAGPSGNVNGVDSDALSVSAP